MMKQRMPVCTDGEEPLTKEEVDAKLRHAGYDPDEVGKKMDTVARQALKIAQLEEKNEMLKGQVRATGILANHFANYKMDVGEAHQKLRWKNLAKAHNETLAYVGESE